MLLLYDALLVCLAIEDYKYQRIKNGYIKIILLLGLMSVIGIPEINPGSRAAGMFIISVPMGILGMFLPGSFGGGDVKLVFASGAFLGWKLVLKGTVVSIFLAGSYSVWLYFIKRKSKYVQFALGPFLSVGYIMAAFTLF